MSTLYNWQADDWPNFTYDSSKLNDRLADYEKLQLASEGVLRRSTALERATVVIEAMTKEARSSSLIEGENIEERNIRNSILAHFHKSHDLSIKDDRALGIANLMLEVRASRKKPLSTDMLNRWHKLVLTESQATFHGHNRGAYREKEMRVVAGAYGEEEIKYVAPPPEYIEKEMKDFIEWYNGPGNQLSKIEKAGIAHLRFESIHPYDDGNGRVGRAIAEHALSEEKDTLLALSYTILKDQSNYYGELNRASKDDNNVEAWMDWFADKVVEAQREANRDIEFIVTKSNFWELHANEDLNPRQIKMINKIFDSGVDGYQHGVKRQQYVNITKAAPATAARDLVDLVKKGVFAKTGDGKGTRYHLVYSAAKPVTIDQDLEKEVPNIEFDR